MEPYNVNVLANMVALAVSCGLVQSSPAVGGAAPPILLWSGVAYAYTRSAIYVKEGRPIPGSFAFPAQIKHLGRSSWRLELTPPPARSLILDHGKSTSSPGAIMAEVKGYVVKARSADGSVFLGQPEHDVNSVDVVRTRGSSLRVLATIREEAADFGEGYLVLPDRFGEVWVALPRSSEDTSRIVLYSFGRRGLRKWGLLRALGVSHMQEVSAQYEIGNETRGYVRSGASGPMGYAPLGGEVVSAFAGGHRLSLVRSRRSYRFKAGKV